MIDVPKNLPNGYSWIQFTFNYPNRTLNQLLEYKESSELPTSPDMILEKMKKFYTRNTDMHETDVGFCMKYIFDHPEIHHMLKEVNDGSYRTNRLFIRTSGRGSIFDNHDGDRFIMSLRSGGPVVYSRELKTEEESVEALEEIINEDKVIFIQFDPFSPCKVLRRLSE